GGAERGRDAAERDRRGVVSGRVEAPSRDAHATGRRARRGHGDAPRGRAGERGVAVDHRVLAEEDDLAETPHRACSQLRSGSTMTRGASARSRARRHPVSRATVRTPAITVSRRATTAARPPWRGARGTAAASPPPTAPSAAARRTSPPPPSPPAAV